MSMTIRRERALAEDGVVDQAPALAVEADAVEKAGEAVAAGLVERRLVALAVGEGVEDIGEPWRDLHGVRRLDMAEIEGGHQPEDHRRPHLGDPAAPEHGDRHAGEEVERGEEADLVEGEHQRQRQDDPRELPPAEPVGHALVEEDEQDRVDEEEDGPPDHQAAHLVHQPEVERPVGDGGREVVEAHGEDQRHHQEIADQQPVDRLADGRRILADIDEEQHRELAGEEHDRTRRDDDAAGELQVEDRGEVGLEEVHRAEGAEDEADAEAMAEAEHARHDGEVQRRLDEEKEQVGPVAHHEAVPMQAAAP